MNGISRRNFAKLTVGGVSTAATGLATDANAVVVTRYVGVYRFNAPIRSRASLATPGVIVGYVPSGTALTGWYNSTGLWFCITSGTYAGRWVSGAVLYPTRDLTTINGRFTSSQLAALPSWAINASFDPGKTRYLSSKVVGAFLSMDTAFRARFGVHLTVTSAYRTYAEQQELYRQSPTTAVAPGTSNHGLGTALDFGKAGTSGSTSPYAYGNTYDVWLTANAWKWGFDRPAYMDKGGTKPEWWHYNFTG